MIDDIDAKLAAFQALWEERRGARALPARREFLVEEFRPWFGHVCISRLERETGRYRMTLCGTAAVEYFGTDLTGRCFDEAFPPDRYEWLYDMYRSCAETRRPVWLSTPPFTYDGTYSALKRVLVPCGEGDAVTMFLLAIYAVR